MLLNESATVSAGHRRLATLAILDREYSAYEARLKQYRRRVEPKDEVIRSPRVEARRMVTERFDTDASHVLFMRDRAGQHLRTLPACQAPNCDECHRVLALVKIKDLCETRDEYRPLLNWILDPAFLE